MDTLLQLVICFLLSPDGVCLSDNPLLDEPRRVYWWQDEPLAAELVPIDKIIPLDVKPQPTTCPPPSGDGMVSAMSVDCL